MVLGNDEINWLLKELANNNSDIASNMMSDTFGNFGQHQYTEDKDYDPGQYDDSYTDLENEILNQMNFSRG
jgi:hypothetical protein